jgi:hypothetical protein
MYEYSTSQYFYFILQKSPSIHTIYGVTLYLLNARFMNSSRQSAIVPYTSSSEFTRQKTEVGQTRETLFARKINVFLRHY